MLAICKIVSTSDDDHSTQTETFELAPSLDTTFVSSRSKVQTASEWAPRRTSKGNMASIVNRSVSMLAALLIEDPQEVDDVQLVGTALAFDPASSCVGYDELNQVLPVRVFSYSSTIKDCQLNELLI